MLLILALIPVVLAAAFGPTWLVLLLLVVVIGGSRRALADTPGELRGLEMPVKMAPPHVGPAAQRRVLVVASDTLGEDGTPGEVEGLPGRRVRACSCSSPRRSHRSRAPHRWVDGLFARARVDCRPPSTASATRPSSPARSPSEDPLRGRRGRVHHLCAGRSHRCHPVGAARGRARAAARGTRPPAVCGAGPSSRLRRGSAAPRTGPAHRGAAIGANPGEVASGCSG